MSASDTLYGYFPSKTVAITFLSLFSVSTLTHIGQALYHRTYFLFITAVVCGSLEILGWSGRLWSSISPFSKAAFNIQICCTIMAPTYLLAANFVIFARLIRHLGTQYSRLGRRYLWVFFGCDVISLGIQGAGGGMAASANTLKSANLGAKVMLGGIAFQLAVIVAFSVCFIEYFIRYWKCSPIRPGTTTEEITQDQIWLLGATGFTTVLLFIRAIYRTIELSEGWTGHIIGTELYFNVLDGGMVVAAICTYNFLHPGPVLRKLPKPEKGKKEQKPFKMNKFYITSLCGDKDTGSLTSTT